ncbi:MAG: hypothetical protein P1U58_07955 [Verrucomicrobiales bacterium]|nr:hypothetical protein [Verrucomicrobiales bacterium]
MDSESGPSEFRWQYSNASFLITCHDQELVEIISRLFSRSPWNHEFPVDLCEPFETSWHISGSSDSWRIQEQHSSHNSAEFSDHNDCLHYLEYQVCGKIIRASPKALPIHAALLRDKNENGILLIGKSGAGKSTLTVKLWESGFDILGDDRCLVLGETTPLIAAPLLRRVSLRSSTFEALSPLSLNAIRASSLYAKQLVQKEVRHLFQPSEIRSPTSDSPTADINAVFLLDPEKRNDSKASKLDPQEALLQIIRSTARLSDVPPSSTVASILDLTSKAPVYSIPRRSLSSMSSTILNLIRSA